MLGKFNLVEQRAFLSLTGIVSVAMAILVSYGLCSAFGVFYGPVHSILPFLLLGIGIDDMFVIVQCWSNLNKEEMKRSLPVRIGITMKHAGVSITITSVTDFAAFAVGATTVTNFDFTFRPFSGREEHIPAMKRIKRIAEDYSVKFQSPVFASARIFSSWETDEVIMEELYRNLAIAMACVFVTTFILIANIYACLMVLLCVILTLVCVNGTMHFWGLTIDTVSCINLVLAIGLCVDYAAHVAHTFMTKCGTRNERASATISSIGPAVFHGGFSTFLAFIFLANSDSHVFTTFFKIFILVVVYGLFHGLIFFPVLLSLIGPPPFPMAHLANEVALSPEELEPQLNKEAESLAIGTLKDEELAIKDPTERKDVICHYTTLDQEVTLSNDLVPENIGDNEFHLDMSDDTASSSDDEVLFMLCLSFKVFSLSFSQLLGTVGTRHIEWPIFLSSPVTWSLVHHIVECKLSYPKMFSRTATFVPQCSQQVRGMATLKMISIRLKSVKNIQKITQSMKMVSAAKYTKAERELKLARPLGLGAQEFYKKAEVKDEEGDKGQLIIACSSDRGLCGAVHSSIGRIVKADIAANPNTKVVIIGDKVRNILQRLYGKNIAMVVTEVGRKPAVFGDAAIVAQSIINAGLEYSKGKILFNTFRTVVSFRTTEMPLYSATAVANASKLPIYDSLDSDVLQSYSEFSLASLLFYSMKENATSEQSSRMTAMDNASKNAGEMIDKLTMTFNRTRQAVITRELIEIISGASALETKN
uniref:F-ATPase gamma subunit n=1 Tax=Scapholeberis mucronata TaxID=202097 RepID=A0A4Y7NMK5_9CRUS|nr:EOG090X0BEK [Scapholeberis mucronata]